MRYFMSYTTRTNPGWMKIERFVTPNEMLFIMACVTYGLHDHYAITFEDVAA